MIDRFYFRSIYFREPSGVLFEIATLGPGFTVDEPLEHLGEKLSLPPDYEHLRAEVEPNLRPVVNPRAAAAAGERRLRLARRRPHGRLPRRRRSATRRELLAEHGFESFELLTHRSGRCRRRRARRRGRRGGPRWSPPGQVPDAAAALLDAAGAEPPRRPRRRPRDRHRQGGRRRSPAPAVAAIPTTLSGAEMTGIHRLPAGAEDRVAALVRPALVIADPEAMTEPARGRAAGELDERPRPRRRLALHALRQPGLAR